MKKNPDKNQTKQHEFFNSIGKKNSCKTRTDIVLLRNHNSLKVKKDLLIKYNDSKMAMTTHDQRQKRNPES